MNAITDCKEFDARLGDYLDHEMEYEARLVMEKHADHCPECGEKLEQALHVLALCAELNEGLSVPLACQQAWRAAIRGEARERGRFQRMGAAARGFAMVAAAVALLMVGTLTLRQQGMLPSSMQTMPWASSSEAGQGPSARSAQNDLSYAYGYGEREPSASTRAASVQADGTVAASQYVGPMSQVPEGTAATEAAAAPIVLRSAVRDIETAEFDTDYGILSDLLVEYDAYFEALSVKGAPLAQGGDGAGRLCETTIRVPEQKLDAFLRSLDVVGVTIARGEYAEDITARYADTQLRLKSLSSQLARLDEMAAGAQTVEDLIAINDRASQLLLEIESLEGTIRSWDALAAYARVTMTMAEVPAPGTRAPADITPLGERIRRSFSESVAWLKAFCADALVVLAMVAPRLVLWIPALIVVIVLWRALARRRRRRRDG